MATWLGRRFRGRWLGLSPPTAQRLPGRLAALAISGGATYDGLIAATALEHELALMTFDVRAERTYAQVGVSLAQPWSS